MSDEILSQNEIDERVIAQADDDAAWEAPIKVNGRTRILAFSESDSVALPKTLLDHVRKLAHGEGVSVNQFVTSAVAEKASISGFEYLKKRAQRGSREKFLKILSQGPDTPSDGEDRMA